MTRALWKLSVYIMLRVYVDWLKNQANDYDGIMLHLRDKTYEGDWLQDHDTINIEAFNLDFWNLKTLNWFMTSFNNTKCWCNKFKTKRTWSLVLTKSIPKIYFRSFEPGQKWSKLKPVQARPRYTRKNVQWKSLGINSRLHYQMVQVRSAEN